MFQQNNPTTHTQINYHMSWPGTDPFYNFNSADGTARQGYYNVQWVPWIEIDGVTDGGSTTAWESHILANAQTTAPLAISLAGNFDYQTLSGSVLVTLDPEEGVSGNYTLQVVLVQDGLYYMGSNGYPDHENVMRDMFPSSSGTTVALEAGVQHVEVVDFFLDPSFIVDDCRLVVFVQGSDQAVLNASTGYVGDIAPLNIPNLVAASSNIIIVGDDGDGKLNPGESAEYTVTVSNSCDFVSAFDVTGYLSTSSPYITITDSVGFYNMIVSCDIVTNFNDKFAFSVSEDAPDISDFNFNLRMVANQSTEDPYEAIIPLTVSIDLFQANFPVAVSQPITGGNAVVDLDGDGTNEVVVGGSDSLVHVFTLAGTELAGFPYATGNVIIGAPAVADIDNDGDLEVVVASRDRKLHVIQHDGTGAAITEASSYLMGTPALDDLDNDGDLEIVAGGYGYDLVAVHHDGTPLDNYPVIIDGGRMSGGVSIADIDGDGSKDLVLGTWSDSVFAYNLNGDLLSGFPVDLVSNVASPPVIADIDGDGSLEILAGQDGGYFYAIGSDGSVLWTQRLSSASIRTSAAVYDFDGDGFMEIIYTTLAGLINMIDYQGNAVAGWPQSLDGACYSSPVVADLDGVGAPEIIVGSNSGELYAFHHDGMSVDLFPLAMSGPVQGTPSVADLSQDGTLEIIVGSNNDLTVINLKMLSELGPTWSTARGNNQRTGFYTGQFLSVDGFEMPEVLQLKQNYPNPFNPSTTIEFGIPVNSFVTLMIYDILGQEVNSLVQSELVTGTYRYQWNGTDASSKSVETGIYFARITAAGSEQIVKMMLLK
ncbi:MAG: VCBS repeat-containing protein [FCB group bacterium]|nr:VCBS repeat-containing protein [FCB group bacterium]MBL7027989.1 VCBS repeat-containing protein [Candidatus Neomarinimicrobiota bacterium]